MCVLFTPSNEFLVVQVATVWLDSDDDDDNRDGDDVNDDEDDDDDNHDGCNHDDDHHDDDHHDDDHHDDDNHDDDNNDVEDDDNDDEDETTTMIVMNTSITGFCTQMLTNSMLPAFFFFSGRTTKGGYKNQSLAFGSWQCHICLGE